MRGVLYENMGHNGPTPKTYMDVKCIANIHTCTAFLSLRYAMGLFLRLKQPSHVTNVCEYSGSRFVIRKK
jgi:hypothetical protein